MRSPLYRVNENSSDSSAHRTALHRKFLVFLISDTLRVELLKGKKIFKSLDAQKLNLQIVCGWIDDAKNCLGPAAQPKGNCFY